MCFSLFKVTATICISVFFHTALLKWTLKSTTRRKHVNHRRLRLLLFEMCKHYVQPSEPDFSVYFDWEPHRKETDLDSSEKQLRGLFTAHTSEHLGMTCPRKQAWFRVCVSGCARITLAGRFLSPSIFSVLLCCSFFYPTMSRYNTSAQSLAYPC